MNNNRLFEPRRELGQTGFLATAVGIGDLADRKVPLETCVATLRRALDAGLNIVDTAPGYEEGYSEEMVGKAIRPYRDNIFVIDKIDELNVPVSPQVEASLKRLRLDHADAFVFHNVSSEETLEKLLTPGGGFDQLEECILAGKTRFRGISSHSPEALRNALQAGRCDLVMFPVGPFVDRKYIDEILPQAKALGVGTVCFKTFGGGKLVGDTVGYNEPLQSRPRGKSSSGGSNAVSTLLPRLSVEECVHYTLTLDPDVALLGLSYPNEQDVAFEAAHSFVPLSEDQMEEIRWRAANAREGKGPCWWNPDPEA